jgi:hypothetical protein
VRRPSTASRHQASSALHEAAFRSKRNGEADHWHLGKAIKGLFEGVMVAVKVVVGTLCGRVGIRVASMLRLRRQMSN